MFKGHFEKKNQHIIKKVSAMNFYRFKNYNSIQRKILINYSTGRFSQVFIKIKGEVLGY